MNTSISLSFNYIKPAYVHITKLKYFFPTSMTARHKVRPSYQSSKCTQSQLHNRCSNCAPYLI